MKCNIKNPATGKIQQGFTLVELLIVVVIAGILAAIAYPSYIQYTVRSNRSAAQSFMLGVANKQEQYILDARQYAGVAADPGDTTGLTTLGMPIPNEVLKNYTVVVGAVTTTPPAYKITATPTGSQLAKDTKCGSLTFTQASVKGVVYATGSAADCW